MMHVSVGEDNSFVRLFQLSRPWWLMGAVCFSLVGAGEAVAATAGLAAVVRHAPNLNGNGLIDGSVQLLLGEAVTLNGGFRLAGDLLLPGTPTLRLKGNPVLAGTIVGSGSASPIGYLVTLNGNVALQYLRPRTTPVTLPIVPTPPPPAGTRNVTITSAGQGIGNPATLRNLTLNGSSATVTVPPGTYGEFMVNGGGKIILGIIGATQPAVYNLQKFDVNGHSQVEIVGPIRLTTAIGFTIDGQSGSTNPSAWLQLQIASGGLTLNGGSTLHALVIAPAGTVTINGNSSLVGAVRCDRLDINGGGSIQWGGIDGPPNQAPSATSQTRIGPEDTSISITLAGSDPEGSPLLYSLLSQPAHGTLVGSAPNLVYTPAVNFAGADSFTFKVNDGQADSPTAVVSITVTPVNDAPVA